MYYVYVLLNEKGEFYIGYSSDLKNRLKAHNEGKVASTKGHKWELIYYEAYKAKEDATMRERQLKKAGQAKRWLKERLAHSIGLDNK